VKQPEELHHPEESFADLEHNLTRGLRHVDPPAGFADRVMARAQASAPPAKVVVMKPRPRVWASGALAATLLLAALVTQQTHARHERQEQAERAQQQFDAGIRITGDTLEHVRQQLQEAGVSLGN
jgi:hypothetical protein